MVWKCIKKERGTIEKKLIEDYKSRFIESINDDLNITSAMSVVWEIIRNPIKSKDLYDVLLDFDKILGLNLDAEIIENKQEFPEDIKEIIEQREKARKEKNWAESDRLRDELQALGYSVKDTKNGMEINKQ